MYEPKIYDHLLGTPGFSDQLLKNHFALYQGYVKNVNLLGEELRSLLEQGKVNTPLYAELKRRFGWEFNGMRLHELYFGNMNPVRSQTPEASADAALPHRISNGVKSGGSKLDPVSKLWAQMDKDFGPKPAWRDDFKAVGAMRGVGWVILYYDPEANKLFNVWVNEHDTGHLAGAVPILVLDVFEHAYMLDYGIKKADYIEAFFKAIDWEEVNKRISNI